MAQNVKHLSAMRETWIHSLGREDPWRRKWQPAPVFLSGKFRGRRSPVGYSPWGRKESDTTEWLHFHFHFLIAWRSQNCQSAHHAGSQENKE